MLSLASSFLFIQMFHDIKLPCMYTMQSFITMVATGPGNSKDTNFSWGQGIAGICKPQVCTQHWRNILWSKPC